MLGMQLISGFRVGKFSDPKMCKVLMHSELCGVERVVIQTAVIRVAEGMHPSHKLCIFVMRKIIGYEGRMLDMQGAAGVPSGGCADGVQYMSQE